MSALDKQRLFLAAVNLRTALDGFILELHAGAEQAPATEPAPPASAPAAGGDCKHTNRTKIPSFGSVEHWICDDCGYEYRR